MPKVTFDESRSIVTLEPDTPLTIEGFNSTKRIIDEHLALKVSLLGLLSALKNTLTGNPLAQC